MMDSIKCEKQKKLPKLTSHLVAICCIRHVINGSRDSCFLDKLVDVRRTQFRVEVKINTAVFNGQVGSGKQWVPHFSEVVIVKHNHCIPDKIKSH